MKIPIWILAITLAGIFSLQSWVCLAIVDLKTDVASIAAKVDFLTKK